MAVVIWLEEDTAPGYSSCFRFRLVGEEAFPLIGMTGDSGMTVFGGSLRTAEEANPED